MAPAPLSHTHTTSKTQQRCYPHFTTYTYEFIPHEFTLDESFQHSYRSVCVLFSGNHDDAYLTSKSRRRRASQHGSPQDHDVCFKPHVLLGKRQKVEATNHNANPIRLVRVIGIAVYAPAYYTRGFEALFLYGAKILSYRGWLRSIHLPDPSLNITITMIISLSGHVYAHG